MSQSIGNLTSDVAGSNFVVGRANDAGSGPPLMDPGEMSSVVARRVERRG